MLLDRGAPLRGGERTGPTGPIDDSRSPRRCTRVIAARLDGLEAAERGRWSSRPVLGKTFSREAIESFTGKTDGRLDPLLGSLVRKEVFSVQSDPLSPDRGPVRVPPGPREEGCVRDAVEAGAKGRPPRRCLPRARRGLDEDEIVEIVASSTSWSYTADPSDDDASEIRSKACEMLARYAPSRLGPTWKRNAFAAEHATELTEEPLGSRPLLERAGQSGAGGGRADEARPRCTSERPRSFFETQGATHPAARVGQARRPWDWRLRRRPSDGGCVRGPLLQEEPDGDSAIVAATLARLLFFSGQTEDAAARVEVALGIAEAQDSLRSCRKPLNTSSTPPARGRQREALALPPLRTGRGVGARDPRGGLCAQLLPDWTQRTGSRCIFEREERVCVLRWRRRSVGWDFEWQWLQMIYRVHARRWGRRPLALGGLPGRGPGGHRPPSTCSWRRSPRSTHRGRPADAVKRTAALSVTRSTQTTCRSERPLRPAARSSPGPRDGMMNAL